MIYAALASLLVVYLITGYIKKRKRATLPPGPAGYPIIGNVLDLPHSYPWITYAEWAKQYGDVMSFTALGRPVIVVSSAKAATELFEKRSTNYSDRPRMILSDELMGWEWNFIHMPYTDRWRRHRRMFHQYFQPRKLSEFYSSQNKLALGLLDQLSSSPDKFMAHIKQYVSAIVLKAAYGYEAQAENDFYVDLAFSAMEPLSHAIHGNYLVEVVPLLKFIPDWFPGAYFQRLAKEGAKKSRDLRDIPFEAVKKSMSNGTARQSFVTDNLERVMSNNSPDATGEEEETVRNCAAVIFIAGTDTTSAVLLTLVLALVNYPEVQKRAQAYIDSITGKTRLPTISDRASLPYIEAMLLETMRWHPIVPLAAPHRVVEEDEYDGYTLPAGATILANTWAILHDEEIYPEPSKFDPERFLQNGNINFDRQPDPSFSFGYGRRICPGRHLAMNSAWIAIASILATYNLSKAVDVDGNIIEPKIEFTGGLVSHPQTFQVQITPRSPDIKNIIEAAKLQG